jgi:hypothetical protein
MMLVPALVGAQGPMAQSAWWPDHLLVTASTRQHAEP